LELPVPVMRWRRRRTGGDRKRSLPDLPTRTFGDSVLRTITVVNPV
jgi:hypothetical protein